jgi:hypothetical protein
LDSEAPLDAGSMLLQNLWVAMCFSRRLFQAGSLSFRYDKAELASTIILQTALQGKTAFNYYLYPAPWFIEKNKRNTCIIFQMMSGAP